MIAPPVINIEYTSYEIYSELTADELKKLELPCRYARIERAVPEGLESMPGDEIAKQTEQVFRIKDYFTQEQQFEAKQIVKQIILFTLCIQILGSILLSIFLYFNSDMI